MRREHAGRAAWTQGLVLGALAVALGAALWHARIRPFDRDTLGIAISQLESKAAEGAVLATQDAAHNVPAACRVAHVGQTRRQLQRTRDALARKDAPSAPARARDDARRLADALDATLARTARSASDPAAPEVFRALADRSGALKDAVDPG